MRMAAHRLFVLASMMAATGLALSGQSVAQDWTQFRGPTRDGVMATFAEPAVWPNSLVQRWKVEVGLGHASPILVGERIYVFARRGVREVLQALEAATGKVVWQTGYDAPVTVNSAARDHGPGPKSTPTFAGGRLYTLGMGGILTAFDASSGGILWQKPGPKVLPLYGTATSVLADRGLAIVHVGGHGAGSITAFDAASGETRWTWSGDGPSYASPVVAEIDGVRQVITLTQENVVAVSADKGTLLWRRPFSTEYTQNIITPLVAGRTVIVAGYQKPTAALTVTKKGENWTVEEAWNNEAAPLYMANAVLSGNFVFGLTHRNSGQYFLLDLKSGKTVWTGSPREAENAAIVRAGNVIFSLEDDADLVVGKVGAERFQELKRYKVSDSETWAGPVISDDRIFVKDATSLALWTLR